MGQLRASRLLLAAIPGIKATVVEEESPHDLGSNVQLRLAVQLPGSGIVRTTTAGLTTLPGAPLATTTITAVMGLLRAPLVLVVLPHGLVKLLLPLHPAGAMVVTLVILATISLAMVLQLRHLLDLATSFNSTASKRRRLLLPTSLRLHPTIRRRHRHRQGTFLLHRLLSEGPAIEGLGQDWRGTMLCHSVLDRMQQSQAGGSAFARVSDRQVGARVRTRSGGLRCVYCEMRCQILVV
jgi:hypothetical protein